MIDLSLLLPTILLLRILLRNVLNEAHILLTPNKEYRKYFGHNPPMTGWRKPKSLKDHLTSES